MSIILYENTQGNVTAVITSISAVDTETLIERLRALPTCRRAHLVMTCDRVLNVSPDTEVEVGPLESL